MARGVRSASCLLVKQGKRTRTKKVRPVTMLDRSIRLMPPSVGAGDDFRTALHNTQMHVKTLASLAKLTPAAPAAAVSGSSPTTTPSSSHSPEIDRQRIETMTKLIDVLQRNLRVRYELNLAEVVQA